MEDKTAGRRAAEYWFVDGLPEMLYGFVFCAFAFGVMAGVHISKIATGLAYLVLAILAITLPTWDRKILEWLKSKITYPRTGYVRPPADAGPTYEHKPITLFGNEPKRRDDNVTMFRSRTLIWMIQAANLGLIAHSRWSTAVLFPLVALVIYFASRRSERPFSLISVLVLAAGGVGASLLNPGEPVINLLPSIWGGTWLLVLGTVKFIKYMHAHPEPEAVRA
jgi:hypothetical protein